MNTVTHIAKPEDSRCAWWQFVVPSDISPKHLESKINTSYLKRGADLELEQGTMIINSEACHHRKSRGFDVHIGLAVGEKVYWKRPSMDIKMKIKTLGDKELMKGSGDAAACIRIALYINKFDTPEKKLEAFLAL